MKTALAALAVLFPLVIPLQIHAQQPAFAVSDGDSVSLLVHEVKAEDRDAYERFMSKVWWPAAQKAAAKYPKFKAVMAQRWRLAPTKPADGVYRYYFLFPAGGLGLPTTGILAPLRAADLAADEFKRDSASIGQLIRRSSSEPLVRREYR